jgi:hypothetical protein
MKLKFIPAKNQKFDIGRTINFTKCDCEKCDFMHCPKHNYALKMVRKKYTVKDFFEENKEEIMKGRKLQDYFNFDTVGDFIDACVSFPKGTYWNLCGDDIELSKINRSKYGSDFLTLAQVNLDCDVSIAYFTGCTNVQEKLAEKIQRKLSELQRLFYSYKEVEE